jgi:hypothetical protein
MTENPITVSEFLSPFEAGTYESIQMIWDLKHSFDQDNPDATQLPGIFRFEVKPTQTEKLLENNLTKITKLLTPFPILEFTNNEANYVVQIPAHRITSVTLEGTAISFTFIPHNTMPITGFPVEKPIAYGVAIMGTDQAQAAAILPIFLKILYLRNEIPRDRCDSCQSLKFLKGFLSMDHALEKKDYICNECLAGAVQLYENISAQYSQLQEAGQLGANVESLHQIVEGGIGLAANVGDDKLEQEFLLLESMLLLEKGDPNALEDSREALGNIVNYCINDLKDTSIPLYLKANSILTQLQAMLPPKEEQGKELLEQEKIEPEISIGQEKESEIPHVEPEPNDQMKKSGEDGDRQPKPEIEATPDFDMKLVGIKMLEDAKGLEASGDFGEAINAITQAAEVLVGAGLWGEQEVIDAQNEINRLKELIEKASKEPELPPAPPPSPPEPPKEPELPSTPPPSPPEPPKEPELPPAPPPSPPEPPEELNVPPIPSSKSNNISERPLIPNPATPLAGMKIQLKPLVLPKSPLKKDIEEPATEITSGPSSSELPDIPDLPDLDAPVNLPNIPDLPDLPDLDAPINLPDIPLPPKISFSNDVPNANQEPVQETLQITPSEISNTSSPAEPEKAIHLPFITPDQMQTKAESGPKLSSQLLRPSTTDGKESNPFQLMGQSHKSGTGFVESSKSGSFLDAAMHKTGQGTKSADEKPKMLFGMPIGQQSEKSSTELKPAEPTNSNDDKLSLAERRKQKNKDKPQVQICPMCGKMANLCTCGYMKSHKS